MNEDKFFNNLRAKIDLLEREKDNIKRRNLIIDIMVNLEKFCHRDNVQIKGVLVDTRERCKKEIHK